MAKRHTKLRLTMHAKARYSERVDFRDSMVNEVKAAKLYGLKFANLQKANTKYFNPLAKYLKRNRIYYNDNIYVFGCDNYYELVTCFPAPGNIKFMSEKVLEILNLKKPKSTKAKDHTLYTYIYSNKLSQYFKIGTINGEIVSLTCVNKMGTDTTKPGFAAYLEKDIIGYIENGQPLNINIKYNYSSKLEQKIYDAVTKLKFGSRITYNQFAKQFKISAVQLSKILNKCTLPILIPTHRIISTEHRSGTYCNLNSKMDKHECILFKRKLLKVEKQTIKNKIKF